MLAFAFEHRVQNECVRYERTLTDCRAKQPDAAMEVLVQTGPAGDPEPRVQPGCGGWASVVCLRGPIGLVPRVGAGEGSGAQRITFWQRLKSMTLRSALLN